MCSSGVDEWKMGRKSIKIEFSDTVRKAQRAYRSKEWETFKRIFADNKTDLLKDFDLLRNTAINMAARSGKPEILKEFLAKLSEEERWRALTKKNIQGNTLLHEIAVDCQLVEMADIVLDFEKTTPLLLKAEEEEDVPAELLEEEDTLAELSEEEEVPTKLLEEKNKEKEEKKRRPLLEWKNLKGETPIFRAAKFGKLKMLSHLVKRVEGNDMKIHEESHGETILHASVNCQSFDVALWIIKNMGNSSDLVEKKNKNDLTCLQLLARVPRAFKSHYDPQELINKLIYRLLPKAYDIEGCNSFELLSPPVRDLETGGQDDARPPTPGHLSRVNYVVWKYLAKVFKWIEPIWEAKKKHQLADGLAEFLVRRDNSWEESYHNERKEQQIFKLPPVLYNVAKRKEEMRWKREKKVMENKEEKDDKLLERYKDFIPLLVAASNGITEIIDWYVKEHPESIKHVNKGGQNILHIAVKHRQKEVFKWLKHQPELSFLASRVDRKNRTALHQVARMDYYRASSLPGAAFQLQEELKWYKRVEKIVQPHLLLRCDNELLTAGDLLDIEHDQMLADAQQWIKQTAQSCSTVAVLVATVVFAAAYTIPGGNNQGSGHALLFRSPVFIFFTVMDIVALAFSFASVIMFLSILNAPFELWDFHKSLPRKLSIGFAFLFLSLFTTMLAFSAMILITIKLPWKQWTSTLVYSAALFPVTIFALIEFPLYKKIAKLFSKLKLCNNKKTSLVR